MIKSLLFYAFMFISLFGYGQEVLKYRVIPEKEFKHFDKIRFQQSGLLVISPSIIQYYSVDNQYDFRILNDSLNLNKGMLSNKCIDVEDKYGNLYMVEFKFDPDNRMKGISLQDSLGKSINLVSFNTTNIPQNKTVEFHSKECKVFNNHKWIDADHIKYSLSFQDNYLRIETDQGKNTYDYVVRKAFANPKKDTFFTIRAIDDHGEYCKLRVEYQKESGFLRLFIDYPKKTYAFLMK
ncbi:MAG: hypothetical protein ACEPOW_03320 [Bacteroidales bacterium]